MNIISVCGIAVISAAAYYLIRRQNPEIALAVPLTATVIIIALSSEGMWQLNEFIHAADTNEFGEYITIPMKALGIMIAGKIAENLCSDEGSVAYAVGLFTKVYIITLSVPLLARLIGILGDVYKI